MKFVPLLEKALHNDTSPVGSTSMSVTRQSGLLGRNARRRVIGVTGALAVAAVETLAVVSWFGLVVDSRTTATAIAGLGILLCGSLLRTGIFDLAVRDTDTLFEPTRLTAALVLTTGWLLWLVVAESVGIVAATVVLAGILTLQLFIEDRACRDRPAPGHKPLRSLVTPAILLAVGSAALLSSAWLTDWTIASTPIALEFTTIVVRVDAVQIGAAVFGLFAFLAHQRRFQHVIDP